MIRSSSIKSNKPVTGMALVAEGGGQRGAFTAGVLDSWLVANFNPFSILVGTSAGAQNIASLLSGQVGYAYSLISDLTRNQQFFNPWRCLKGHNIMDLDWYFSKAKSEMYNFDHHNAQKQSVNRTVRFSASSMTQTNTTLIDPNKSGWLTAMKYSSSIPFLYKSNKYVDGGVTAPVPVREAFNLGAKKIVTIRTVLDMKHSAVPKPITKLKPMLCRGKRCPSFINVFEQHAQSYSQAEQFIQDPPEGVDVVEIKPQRPLHTKVLGSSQTAITADYRHGLQVGQHFLSTHGQQLIAH